MRARSLALAFLLLACGGEREPPAPAEVAPEPAEDPPPEVVEDDPEPETEPSAPVALELPDPLPAIEQLPSTRREAGEDSYGDAAASWPEVTHPDESVRETLATIAFHLVRRRSSSEFGARCSAVLRHPSLVSFECEGDTSEGSSRGQALWEGYAALYAIAGPEVRPASIDEAFLEGGRAAARELADARCERDHRERFESEDDDEDAEYFDYWYCNSDRAVESLGAGGYRVRYPGESTTHHGVTVPWAELASHLRADGILAPVFTDAEPTPPTRVHPDDARAWALTPSLLERSLVRAWVQLDADLAGAVRVQRFGQGVGRLVLPEADALRAGRIARALDASATPLAELPPTEPLGWMRTRRDLNLRRPGIGWITEVLMVLPRGTVLPVVGEAVNQPRRVNDAHGAFVSGQLASRWLTPWDGCALTPPAALGDRGEVIAAAVQVRRAGRARPGALFISHAEGHTRVAVHALDEASCAVGDVLVEGRVEGAPRDVRLTGTTPRGGDSLLLVGAVSNGTLRYVVRRAGRRDDLWTHAFELEEPRPGHRAEEPEERVWTGVETDAGYFPLGFADGDTVHRLAWRDGALVDVPPPE